MKKMSIIYDALLELHAEMVWDHSIRNYREKQLQAEIDQALKDRDQEKFIQLTNELNQLING